MTTEQTIPIPAGLPEGWVVDCWRSPPKGDWHVDVDGEWRKASINRSGVFLCARRVEPEPQVGEYWVSGSGAFYRICSRQEFEAHTAGVVPRGDLCLLPYGMDYRGRAWHGLSRPLTRWVPKVGEQFGRESTKKLVGTCTCVHNGLVAYNAGHWIDALSCCPASFCRPRRTDTERVDFLQCMLVEKRGGGWVALRSYGALLRREDKPDSNEWKS